MILVVLQLSGGNDGLNTLIPFADPNYSSLRPVLGVQSADVLKLTDSVGLNPNLSKLKAFYDHVGGFGHLLMMGQGGLISHEDTVDNLTMFSREVLPRLTELA